MIRATPKRPCPACGKHDYCYTSDDGVIAYCMRVSAGSFMQARNGAHMHRLTDDPVPRQAVTNRATPLVTPPAVAPLTHRDGVYCKLLRGLLTLSEGHRRKLTARGLSPSEIERLGYRSAPAGGHLDELAEALAPYDLEGVPGFYRDDLGAWHMRRTPAGVLIPVRDHRGRVQALQIRRDEGAPRYLWLSTPADKFAGGASSGAPVHCAQHHLLADAEEVTITEGALKADVCGYLLQAPVLGVAGVSTFGRDFASTLRGIAPRVRSVRVAYDRDLLQKEEVYSALMRLVAQLEGERFQVRVRTWSPPHKGYDDFLLAHLTSQEVAA